MPTNPQVVTLSDVMREDHPRSLAQPRQHGKQHPALERLRFVHDDERVVQRPATDVGEREHLQHPAIGDLFDDVLGDQRAEGVEDGLCPRRHLLVLAARQIAEVLTADGVQRPEHHDPTMQPPFHHRLEPCAQRQRGLSGTGPPTERDDPDVGIEE